MKKILFFIFCLTSCYYFDDTPENSAKQSLITDREYKDVLLNNLKETTRSLKVIMFVIRYSDNSVREILNQILNLKKAGIDIKIVLDKTTATDYPETTNFLIKNEISFKLYTKSTLHTKMVIFDDETVILGSHNWTDAALNQNREVSILSRDEKIVEKSKTYFEEIYNEVN